MLAGGNAGSGCDGSLEEFHGGEIELCAAKMVEIPGPEDGTSYWIDATEVTVGQYWQWLNTDPPLPPSTNTLCGWKASGTYEPTDTTFIGNDQDHHPITYVDWCDAQYYCSAVGKRLCGGIGGGSNPYDSFADATRSQWYRACSSGGVHVYPYGDMYEECVCNAGNNHETTAVGSLSGCTSTEDGYAGVYDQSGNVLEWEDSCKETQCRYRGGAYGYVVSDENDVKCHETVSYGVSAGVQQTFESLGFRCCSR